MSKLKSSIKVNAWPYIFLSPYFAMFLVFSFFPILFSLYISFTNWDGIGKVKFIGLKNYINLFTKDPYFFKALGNTFILMLSYLPALLICGLLLAVILHNQRLKFRNVFQLVNFMPYITTPVAVGIIFALIFDWRTGLLNRILIELNLSQDGINWLGKAWNARFVVSLISFWKGLGYYMIIYLSGLSSISYELYEAAIVDGANYFQRFLKITVPLLKPVTTFLLITGIIGGFKMIDEPMLLLTGWATGNASIGGPDYSCLTPVWYLYDIAFGSSMKYGMGSAVAYGLFIFIVVVSLINYRITNRSDV